MRISVHLKLPGLYKEHSNFEEKIKKLINKWNVTITKLDKESIYEVSNNLRLGPSEIKQIQDVYDTVVKLIKLENKFPKEPKEEHKEEPK